MTCKKFPVKPVVHACTEKRGESGEPTLVVFRQVDVDRSFLRFLDFRSSMWAPKSRLRKSVFVEREALKTVLAKRSLR